VSRLERRIKKDLSGLVARLARRPRITADQLRALPLQRIIIVRQQNQMGDMVCATPSFRALAETYPQARLTLVTAPVNVEVVRHNPHLAGVLTFDQKMWRNPVRLWQFIRQIRQVNAEVAFVLSSVSFSVTSAAIGLISGARYVVGANSEPFGLDVSRHAFSLEMPATPQLDEHAIKHSLAPLKALGIDTDDLSTVVVPAPDEVEAAAAIMEDLALQPDFWAVHPGAGKSQNVWPADRFAVIIAKVVAAGHQVLVLHGPADRQPLNKMMQELADNYDVGDGQVLVAPRVPIGVGAALLQKADRFLCNDTGVMHLAGALSVPTVALFGPTDPALWKPLSDNVVAVQSPGRSEDARGSEYGWMENLATDTVWSALADLTTNR
jgi:ADP-heptose:LPS heptosyltransferase